MANEKRFGIPQWCLKSSLEVKSIYHLGHYTLKCSYFISLFQLHNHQILHTEPFTTGNIVFKTMDESHFILSGVKAKVVLE